jgi:hypothetical protein
MHNLGLLALIGLALLLVYGVIGWLAAADRYAVAARTTSCRYSLLGATSVMQSAARHH